MSISRPADHKNRIKFRLAQFFTILTLLLCQSWSFSAWFSVAQADRPGNSRAVFLGKTRRRVFERDHRTGDCSGWSRGCYHCVIFRANGQAITMDYN